MASAPSLADLGDGLIGRILRFLPCLAHRALFSAVCRKWRDVAHENQPGEQLPWLLLPSSAAAGQEPCFFCLRCRTRHRAVFPDDVRGARCIGSSQGGSLILALQQTSGYKIRNLHNGRRVSIPEIPRVHGPDNDNRMVIHAACFAVRNEGAGRVVYVARWSAYTIAFWSIRLAHFAEEPHGRHFWPEVLPHGSIADVVYYRGHGLGGFHVLTDHEEVLVYVPGRAPDGEPTMHMVAYHFPTHEVTPCTITRYLVRHVDELLMVVRLVTPEGLTREFRVWKLVPGPPPPEHGGDHGVRVASWEPMHVIPSGMIILGRCCSRTYQTYGVDFDGVYFLDDATSSQDEATRVLEPAATRQYPCSDMGFFPLRGTKIQAIFPRRLPSESSRAVWFFP
jgi:hypothetical protein